MLVCLDVHTQTPSTAPCSWHVTPLTASSYAPTWQEKRSWVLRVRCRGGGRIPDEQQGGGGESTRDPTASNLNVVGTRRRHPAAAAAAASWSKCIKEKRGSTEVPAMDQNLNPENTAKKAKDQNLKSTAKDQNLKSTAKNCVTTSGLSILLRHSNPQNPQTPEPKKPWSPPKP